MSIYMLDATLAAFLLAAFIHDRFKGLNDFADAIERDWFPRWLQFNAIGDVASWIQHAITAAAIGTAGGVLSLLLLGDFAPGFRHFSRIAFAFYVVREAHQLREASRKYGWRGLFRVQRVRQPYQRGLHVSPATDYLMDQVGPALIVLLAP